MDTTMLARSVRIAHHTTQAHAMTPWQCEDCGPGIVTLAAHSTAYTRLRIRERRVQTATGHTSATTAQTEHRTENTDDKNNTTIESGRPRDDRLNGKR